MKCIFRFNSNRVPIFWRLLVRLRIGPFATPDVIQSAPILPKTRSGKIMRRILRQVAKNDHETGDLSTIYDPAVVTSLFEGRPHVPFLPIE